MTFSNLTFRGLAASATLLLSSCVWTPTETPTPIAPVVAPAPLSAAEQERDARLNALMDQLIEEKAVPGISVLVIKGGQERYFGLRGLWDRENEIAMTRQSVGRYYSMTKPIVGVALMTLYEAGKFELDDPIAKYMPEFSDLQVMQPNAAGDGAELVATVRAVTIRDLMRHTSGMTYGVFSNTPVDQMYRAAKILSYEDSNAEFTAKLGKLPLLAQPGSKWIYSVSADVQGRLIEVLSGMSLGEYLSQTIFEPLGMVHTGFQVRQEDRELFGPAYRMTEKKRLHRVSDSNGLSPLPTDFPFLNDISFESGGGGLVSTIDDYAAFAKMVAAGGALGETRILKTETLAQMTQDQLGDADHSWLGKDVGFGLDFAVQIGNGHSAGPPVPVGSHSWGGMAGTFFWVDPQNDLTVLMQIQVISADLANVRNRLVAAVYGVELAE
ncbi:MAG: serine hydrolase [Robiginitomaculum sp.]|nr:MAG: serine hydrolase [Robiginitomaculum sp.]